MKEKNLFIVIFLVFVFSFFSSQVQTSFGDTKIVEIKFPTENGQWVLADLFKPITATKENPAPLVIVIPGFQRSRKPYQTSLSSFREEVLLSLL